MDLETINSDWEAAKSRSRPKQISFGIDSFLCEIVSIKILGVLLTIFLVLLYTSMNTENAKRTRLFEQGRSLV